jgi:hypothetical protein
VSTTKFITPLATESQRPARLAFLFLLIALEAMVAAAKGGCCSTSAKPSLGKRKALTRGSAFGAGLRDVPEAERIRGQVQATKRSMSLKFLQ